MGFSTSDEELSYMPGSIHNLPKQADCRNVYNDVAKRVHRDLRELYEASLGDDAQRLQRAQERALNTLGWLEY